MKIFPEGSDPTASQDWSGLSPSGELGSCQTRTPATSPLRGRTPGTSMYVGVGSVVDVEVVLAGCVVSGLVGTTVSDELGANVSGTVLGANGEVLEAHPADNTAINPAR